MVLINLFFTIKEKPEKIERITESLNFFLFQNGKKNEKRGENGVFTKLN